PPAFAPGLEGSTVANVSALSCLSGWGTRGASKAAVDRCCLLRACCYAKLAARRCKIPSTQQASIRPGACRKFLWPRWVQDVGCGGPGSPNTVLSTPAGSRSWCERGACRCERQAQLCRLRARLPGARRKCRAGGGC
ncbi:PA2A1 phospholipase, partial [Eudromia elegans]|nr:PA2A1 phospholipase [Eudromia elegans]